MNTLPSTIVPASLISILAVSTALAVTGCTNATGESAGSGSAAYSIPDPSAFALPPSDPDARAAIVGRYAQLDPQGIVPRGLLEDAIEFLDVNKALIPNQGYLTIVDFSKFSGDDRFFLVDMQSGAVETHKVAHGHNSDPSWTGWATSFGNVSGSLKSSLGFYMGGEIYSGNHPHSMRLDGLSPDGSPNSMANTNVRQRLVVMHEASYVSDSNTSKQGRSDGCLALDPNIEQGVVDRLANGSIIYAEIAPLNPPVGTGVGSDAGSDSGGADAGSDSASSGTPCNSDGDCNTGSDGSGQICVSGTCVAGCNADWECPGSTTCVSGQCQ